MLSSSGTRKGLHRGPRDLRAQECLRYRREEEEGGEGEGEEEEEKEKT